MTEILAAGGTSYLIPAVLFVLVLYVARGLFGLHGRRSQSRKEFLELWESARSQDDLWLEISVRHLFGAYLPTHVIRIALQQPDKAQSLLDLAEVWSLFQFDPETRTVNWKNKRHLTSARRRGGQIALLSAYFACALFAVLSAVIAANSGPSSLLGWVYGFCATVLGALAIICLLREDTIKTAASVGQGWVDRINQSANKGT